MAIEVSNSAADLGTPFHRYSQKPAIECSHSLCRSGRTALRCVYLIIGAASHVLIFGTRDSSVRAGGALIMAL